MKPSFNHDEMLMKPYLEHHGKKGRGPFERYLDSNRLTKKPASDLSDDEIKKLLAKELRG